MIGANPTAYLGHENEINTEPVRTLAWLSNLHYWMVLMMLDVHYREGSEALNAMSQTHMIGPLQSLAGELAKYGTGLPFDQLSVGYSPARDAVGNVDVIRRLSVEADTFVQRLGDDLPANYPTGLHKATLAVLDGEAERLSAN